MTKRTIVSLSNNAVEFIAKSINCEATKEAITKQLKTKASEMDKAYTAFKLSAKAEAEARKQQKAEEEAEKQKKLEEAKQTASPKNDKQKKDDKQKKEDKQKQKKEAEAEKLSDIKAQYRKNSLQLNEKQAEFLNDYIAEFEVMRWGCNKNMITLYYKNKQAIEIVASTRALRISTKEAFATSTYETRRSGYGVDFTKKLKDEKALATELKALVSRVKKQTAEAEKKKQKEAEQKEESK